MGLSHVSRDRLITTVTHRALLVEPEVLICDEATSALDALTQRSVLQLLQRMHRDRGLSLVMITHEHSQDLVSAAIPCRGLHLNKITRAQDGA